jgi:hypothetical protein
MPRITLGGFLRSFDPSLRYLHPMFVRAGIDNEAALMVLTSWGPYHVDNFFSGLQDPKTRGPLDEKIRCALVDRFCHQYCLCGKCPNPLPPCRTCNGKLLRV